MTEQGAKHIAGAILILAAAHCVQPLAMRDEDFAVLLSLAAIFVFGFALVCFMSKGRSGR